MSSPELRGGDQWYNERPRSLCFRAAVVVHRLGVANSHDVAKVCGISPAKAYEFLWYCAQHPKLFHVQRIAPGRFAPLNE
jgi:predicted GNAT superfamily acetyltransferase